MSAEYEGKDLNQIAAEAEQDVNSRWAKEGHRADDDKAAQSAKYGASDSTKVSVGCEDPDNSHNLIV